MPRPTASILFGVTSDQTLVVLRPRILALRRAGFSIAVLSSPGPHHDRLAIELRSGLQSELESEVESGQGIAFYPIAIRRGIAPLADALAFLRIFVLLLRLRPAAVDFSTPKAALLGLIAARLLRIRLRIHTLRGLRAESANTLLRPLLLLAERLTSSCAHVVLCNSPSLLQQATLLSIAPPRKLRMLAHGSSHGVDLDHYHPGISPLRAKLGIPPDAQVFGFVGRLTRHKGIPELIDAFDQIAPAYPNGWLLLVGWLDQSEDSLSPALARHIASHPRITLTGFVEDVAPFYRAMDIFILPTHREGFPNAALEAAATALAIITTTATGARDAVVPDQTGLLVPPSDSAALAAAMRRLLDDPALRRQMGNAARAWVEQNYAQQDVLDATVSYFQEMLPQPVPDSMRAAP